MKINVSVPEDLVGWWFRTPQGITRYDDSRRVIADDELGSDSLVAICGDREDSYAAGEQLELVDDPELANAFRAEVVDKWRVTAIVALALTQSAIYGFSGLAARARPAGFWVFDVLVMVAVLVTGLVVWERILLRNPNGRVVRRLAGQALLADLDRQRSNLSREF
ncbi:hypothetical protein ITJ58_18210 [Curtobacterium flaccumfaciens]|uniref:hypothetical protein n=1 Tax=Curtobacterium flaccumfaciens TaxID=2035 RepID=UPI00188D20F8|nr:hypothetical protein [Curtobacterium flaccumfaciens]MBF4595699.1 hypothetical protein [Curtobacterium flaccumfaciens]